MSHVIPIGLDFDLMEKIQEVSDAVERGLDIAANLAAEMFLEPTSNWDNGPVFEIDREHLKRKIYTANVNYVRINYGTAAHYIDPVRAKALRIQNRSPKTREYSYFSYDSSDTGAPYFRNWVHNPGIKPRKWDEMVAKDFYGYFSSTRLGGLDDIIQAEINKIP